jgi:hypothetical protein
MSQSLFMRSIKCKTCGQEILIPLSGETCPYCGGHVRKKKTVTPGRRVTNALFMLMGLVFLVAAIAPWVPKDSGGEGALVGDILITIFFLILAGGMILLGRRK